MTDLVIYDDGGDANKARTFATRLIEDDEVIAMVGGTTTGSTMAMIPVFEEAKVPFISLAGAIEVHRHLDVGLVGLSLDLGGAHVRRHPGSPPAWRGGCSR